MNILVWKNNSGPLRCRDLVFCLFCLIPLHLLWGEGIKQVAPTAEDHVMLLINDPDFGRFASIGAVESSRLNIRVGEAGETVYFGFSRSYTPNGQPESFGAYAFQVRRASDNALVHGPVLVTEFNENVNSWADAVAGPAAIDGEGYPTNEDFQFTAPQSGDYYIEFSGLRHLGFWDITVARDGIEQTGRIYSKNWAFRTPEADPQLPDCGWGEVFNGRLYSYTADGFVTEIDFMDSGFQGLSFNVAFNRTGPGNTGDPETDRQSVPGQNLTQNASEHLVFLNDPDPVEFPDGVCGEAILADRLQCSEAGLCIPVSVTRVGQVEVLLDFAGDGQFDPTIDRIFLSIFDDPAELQDCIFWDGLMADGQPPSGLTTVDIRARYTQGVQHWALYDAEFLRNGFCINVIRPACARELANDQLYYDDRNIPFVPGTGSPKDGRMGCSCTEPNCRTFTNFNANTNDCELVNDNLTTGYGDKNTLNTWWSARSTVQTQTDIPLLAAELVGPEELCQLTTAELRLDWQSNTAIAAITWRGPEGVITDGGPELLSITVATGGTYEVTVVDESGCSLTLTHEIAEAVCPIDLSLDKSVSETAPSVGQAVDYQISVRNEGPGIATGVRIVDNLPTGLADILMVNYGGQISNGQLVWNDLTLGVGEELLLRYRGTVVPAFQYRNRAQVVAADQPDLDSTPGNGVDTNGNGTCVDDPGDEDDGDCVQLFPPACALTTSVTNVVCQDNGTPVDPTDDTWTFDLTVTGTDGAATWRTESGLSLIGTYGTTTTVGPLSIAAGPVNFIVVDGFFGAACAETVTVTPPATCSDQCLLQTEVFGITCLDNGTVSDDSDDLYVFQYVVTGFNTGAQWLGPDGLSGNYGETYTYGPVAIDAAAETSFTVRDAERPACEATVTAAAPNTCSTVCSITAMVSNVRCDDNGTSSQSDDDQFFFTLTVTGANTSAGWTTAAGYEGGYGVPQEIGPLPIADGPIDWVIGDLDQSGCVTSVAVAPPATCSDECAILDATLLAVDCDPVGTESDASDDLFYATVLVDGLNLGTHWSGGGYTGPYGEPVRIGPFLIGDGPRNLVFRDAADEACTSVLSVIPPPTCSNVCAIEDVLVSDIVCDDRDTPTDPTDDAFWFTLTVNGANLAAMGWSAPTGESGNYLEPVTLGPYPIADGLVSLFLQDRADPACEYAVSIAPPPTCSDQCAFTVDVLAAFCEDSGTPLEPDDDIFFVPVIATAINATATGWTTGSGPVGTYGDTVLLGPYPIVAGDLELEIRDEANPACSQSIAVAAPASCSDFCEIEIVDLIPGCNDQGTDTPADDVFYYDVLINSTNGSADGWVASDGTTGQYGVWTTSVALSAESTLFEITFVDRENDCSVVRTVAVPQPTVACPPPFVNDYQREANWQLLSGSLQTGDNSWTDLANLCWLPGTAFKAGTHYYDQTTFRTPGSDSVGAYYTFLLFSDVAPPADWDPTAADGVGAVFTEVYEPGDPCCSLTSWPVPPLTTGESLAANPTIDPAQWLDPSLQLVQQFSTVLSPATTYQLLTTTWGAEQVGNYQWVVLSYAPEATLQVVPGENAVETVVDTVSFDLTEIDFSEHFNEAYGPDLLFGSLTLDSDCGVREIRLRDEIVFADDCVAIILGRSFEMEFGGEVIPLCDQDILLRRLTLADLVLPPATWSIACDDAVPLLPDGTPDPSYTGVPSVHAAAGLQPIDELGLSDFSVAFEDIPLPGNEPFREDYQRRWSILDHCGDTVFIFDQLLKLESPEPAILVCPLAEHYCPILEEDIMLFSIEEGACTADVLVPEPALSGGCNADELQFRTEVLEVAAAADTILLRTLEVGDSRLLTDWPAGDYLIRYIAIAPDGGEQTLVCRFRVADLSAPVAICRDKVSLSISGSGQRRLAAAFFDLGSYDDCSEELTVQVRRAYGTDPISCLALDSVAYGEWKDYVEFTCCDVGQTVWVEMRLLDAGLNANFCSIPVRVVDNTVPYCTGLTDQQLDCADLPFGFNPLDTLQLQAYFGMPTVVDNCSAYAVELSPVVSGEACAIESIRRRFVAIDTYGNQSSVFEQLISLDYSEDYVIRFPRDTVTDCLSGLETAQVTSRGCTDFAISYVDMPIVGAGQECRRIARTYTVIDTCRYDGSSLPFLIGRDEDCDGDNGEEEVFLVRRGGAFFIDADTDPMNAIPLAGTLGSACANVDNPEGYWREAATTGAYRYTQYISLFDTTPPTVEFTGPATYCVSEEEACDLVVELPFRVSEACLLQTDDLVVQWDRDDDGTFDGDLTTGGELLGTYPDYFLRVEFPVGTHRLRITATDECDNTASAEWRFTVADCYLPPSVCHSGRRYDLAALTPATDVDGDGEVDVAAVRVPAADLVSCETDNCSNPIRFSVNRLGEVPDPEQSAIWLTCADRYKTQLEVYVWDSADNPLAVQPDGSLGGPNWRRCVVEVFLQDPQLRCTNCPADGSLSISGSVLTPQSAGVADVTIHWWEEAIQQDSILTNPFGNYALTELQEQLTYQLEPHKNDDVAAGVSLLDILAIWQHILGTAPFTSAYQYIAADVDNSGHVSSLDLFFIQQLLLGKIAEFPNNTSWRFVPQTVDLSEPEAWSSGWSPRIVVPDVVNCSLAKSWVGVKVGDLTGSTATNNLGEVAGVPSVKEGPAVALYAPDRILTAGVPVRIDLRLPGAREYAGGSFELNWDPKVVQITEVGIGELATAQLDSRGLASGRLRSLWLRDQLRHKTGALMTLTIIPRINTRLREILSLADRAFPSVVFTAEQGMAPLALRFEPTTADPAGVEVLASPNPFADDLRLSIGVPRSGLGDIKVSDALGTVHWRARATLSAGWQEQSIPTAAWPAGVYYCQFTFEGTTQVYKVIKQ